MPSDMDMGLGGSLEWVTAYGKMRCRSLFWRVRAAVKKAVKNAGKQQLKFQYDPSSYALNFDDGCCHLVKGVVVNDSKLARLQDFPDIRKTAWIYVVQVKAE